MLTLMRIPIQDLSKSQSTSHLRSTTQLCTNLVTQLLLEALFPLLSIKSLNTPKELLIMLWLMPTVPPETGMLNQVTMITMLVPNGLLFPQRT